MCTWTNNHKGKPIARSSNLNRTHKHSIHTLVSMPSAPGSIYAGIVRTHVQMCERAHIKHTPQITYINTVPYYVLHNFELTNKVDARTAIFYAHTCFTETNLRQQQKRKKEKPLARLCDSKERCTHNPNKNHSFDFINVIAQKRIRIYTTYSHMMWKVCFHPMFTIIIE